MRTQQDFPSAAPWFYRLLLTLIVPFALIRLWWRGRKQPGYRAHIAERFGFIDIPAGNPVLWVHAVSVGETRAVEPLIHALLTDYPQHRILLTHMTPTGRATSQSLYTDPRILVAYLPYDLVGAVDRFLQRVQPQIGLLMETEIWPNLILRCRYHHVPVALINARLSERSARRYGRFEKSIRPILAALSATGAQTSADATRLIALGANAATTTVTGNLKFDICVSPTLQQQGRAWRADATARPIWLAASTREGEEVLILAAQHLLQEQLKTQNPLLVLVPRHPQRFNEVAAQAMREGFSVARRSEGLPNDHTDVWIGDSMGEMVAYYSMADVAVIGGSLLPFGGQNLIEAAACGTPTILGPHTYNFTDAANAAVSSGAAHRLQDTSTETLAASIATLLTDSDQHQHAVNATATFVTEATGATEKTMVLIASLVRLVVR